MHGFLTGGGGGLFQKDGLYLFLSKTSALVDRQEKEGLGWHSTRLPVRKARNARVS